jgi:hypothetical protein
MKDLTTKQIGVPGVLIAVSRQEGDDLQYSAGGCAAA